MSQVHNRVLISQLAGTGTELRPTLVLKHHFPKGTLFKSLGLSGLLPATIEKKAGASRIPINNEFL